ncbi:MAG: M48 family metallopeptidase [Polyangiaceae bacterium]
MNRPIRGRLFGGDLPGAGASAIARWNGDALEVQLEQMRLVLEHAHLRATGFNGQSIEITGRAEERVWVFTVTEDDARRNLKSTAPPARRDEIESALARAPMLRRRLVSLAVVALFGLVLVTLFAWFAIAALGVRAARSLPVETESVLGEATLARVRLRSALLEQGPAVDALRIIGSKLTPNSRYDYHYFVAKDPSLNAFAAPGGIVVVTSGLIAAAEAPEELAGVIAHEIAHAELRHTTVALFKSMGIRGLLGVLLGGIDRDLAGAAAHLTELTFSREAEREADREGMRRLEVARIAPDGLLRMFRRLEADSASKGFGLPTFLSTHPDLDERIRFVETHLRTAHAESEPLRVDWAMVRASVR